MARLPRLAIGGEVHLVVLEGHNRQPIFVDDQDRQRMIEALREARSRENVALHAYALVAKRVWLLLTPPDSTRLGRMMQSVGRRYTAAFNRRHGRSGTLWAGRFGSTVVEAGEAALEAMVFVEQAPVRDGGATSAAEHAWSTGRHHLAATREPMLTEIGAYWALGNTPFERVAAYSRLLEDALPAGRVAAIERAARRGWALGAGPWVHRLQQQISRRLRAGRAGRPARGVPGAN